jgi:hypothetical protein
MFPPVLSRLLPVAVFFKVVAARMKPHHNRKKARETKLAALATEALTLT